MPHQAYFDRSFLPAPKGSRAQIVWARYSRVQENNPTFSFQYFLAILGWSWWTNDTVGAPEYKGKLIFKTKWLWHLVVKNLFRGSLTSWQPMQCHTARQLQSMALATGPARPKSWKKYFGWLWSAPVLPARVLSLVLQFRTGEKIQELSKLTVFSRLVTFAARFSFFLPGAT